MNKTAIIIVLIIIVVGVACLPLIKDFQTVQKGGTLPISITPIFKPSDTPSAMQPIKTSQKVKVFYVATNDAGKSGRKIGCDDSLVATTVDANPDAMPVMTALQALLNEKHTTIGQSGLYNAVANSQLTVDSIDTSSAIPTVKLKGQLSSGGVCDDPRIIEQLKATILQSDKDTKVNILVNGKNIEEALSQK